MAQHHPQNAKIPFSLKKCPREGHFCSGSSLFLFGGDGNGVFGRLFIRSFVHS